MGPSWNSLFRFSENSIKSKHKIEQSGNLRNLWDFFYYFSYVRDYKATLVGGNKYFTTGDKIYKEISLIQHMSFDIHSCNKVKGWYTQSDE